MAKTYTQEEVDALKAEVERLQGALQDAASASEEAARRAMFFRDDNEERPTGKTVKVTKCVGYEVVGHTDEGIPRRRPIWDEVEQPTFYYKIDMPPVGGVDIKINGESLYHGETYTLTLDQLRMVKEIVYRLRDHEATIHGTDENVYRPKTNAQFSGKTGSRIH